MIETTGEGKSAVATPDGKKPKEEEDLRYYVIRDVMISKFCGAIDDFRGAYAVNGNVSVAGHVKRVDHGDLFYALLFREETLTRHYFILKFDFSWGIRTNMGKTEGIFLNLQCNCHIVGSIIIKLINHRTISVHGCQI